MLVVIEAIASMPGQGVASMMSLGDRNEIRTALPELEAACNRAIEAAEDFGTLCQLIGLKAGTDPAVVKAFVSARCKETVAKAEAKAEQISILFDEIE